MFSLIAGYWKATGPNKFIGRGTQVADFCRGFSKGYFSIFSNFENFEKLHPCIETLNSRNLGLAKDSFKVSFGFRTLSRPRLIKDPKNVKNHWFYCVFAHKC